ncbi:recombinase family protein [uncultured Amphritea sp.]|uniref:recombinase family protein n=1 Tax=uncultured Amphritea sp. TaxID=981605 RepID=UPI00260B79D5|nr:recombinase family protein [uncultured Amphritea sp.]
MTNTKTPLAYVRVSTKKQSTEGSSPESQFEIIDQFAGSHGYQINSNDRYMEVASGLRQRQLARAGALRDIVQRAIEEQRPIVVTRVDRLTRSVAVLKEIIDSGITIIEAEYNDTISPERAISYLNKTDRERQKKLNSQQIAYDRKRVRDEGMGNPDIAAVQKRAAAAVKSGADTFMRETFPLIEPLIEQGMNPNQIAKALNERGVPTPRGAPWSRNAVTNLIGRHQESESKLADPVKNRPHSSGDLNPEGYADHPDFGLFS